jgi:hypothetical protein
MLETLVILGCLLATQAPPAPNRAMAADVQQWVGRLDAPQLADRNAAEARLIALGPDILPFLPATDTDASAEVRQRLDHIRQRLQQQSAAATIEASRVTIRDPQIKLSKLLAEIERQTGNRVIVFHGSSGRGLAVFDPLLAVDFDRTDFWTALQFVLKRTDLTVYPFSFVSGRAMHLLPRPTRALPFGENACHAGPFLFVPLELSARRNLTLADEGILQLTMLVAWEPRLAPITLVQRLKEIEAVDERNGPLAVDAASGTLEVPVRSNVTAVSLGVSFAIPPRSVQRIARLSGAIDVTVPGRVETFRFDRLAEATGAKQRIASATVTLVGAVKNGDVWQVEIRVRFDEAGDALASHRGWIFENEAYLEGPDGQRIANAGYDTKSQTENEVGLAYSFRLNESLEKYTFVYRTPARIFTTQVKYELRNLNLP